jgi:CDP-diacylglycerol--glycerol-3-phosphate 3-phosphatidyltransferase
VLAVLLPFVPAPLRLPLVASAASTDFLDGWIARRFRATTELGRLLDGVADKAFALAVVLTLTFDGAMRPWQGLLVLARDVVVALMAGWLALRHAWAGFEHMQVRWSGKVTTLFAFLWFLALLVGAPAGVHTPLFLLAAAASLWAATEYTVAFFRRMRAT